MSKVFHLQAITSHFHLSPLPLHLSLLILLPTRPTRVVLLIPGSKSQSLAMSTYGAPLTLVHDSLRMTRNYLVQTWGTPVCSVG